MSRKPPATALEASRPTEPRQSERIMAELVRDADTISPAKLADKRRATLARLKEACDAIEPHKEISGVAIEAYCKTHYKAGPRAQSVANDRKKRGRPGYLGMWHYVEARKGEQTLAGKRRRPASTLDAIDAIDDPDLRAQLRDLYDQSHLNALAAQRAKSLFARTMPGVNFEDWIEAWKEGDGAVVLPRSGAAPVRPEHVQALADAVRALTDPETLDRCGLVYDGKRVKRKGGTEAPLLGLHVVTRLADLHQALAGAEAALGTVGGVSEHDDA